MIYNWLSKNNFAENNRNLPLSNYLGIKEASELNLKEVDVVILGCNKSISDAIRKELYQLGHEFPNIIAKDLGEFKRNETSFMANFLREMAQSNINTIIVSQSDPILSQLAAHKDLLDTMHAVIVDQKIDISEDSTLDIVLNKDYASNCNLSFLGFQRHFGNPIAFKNIDPAKIELANLGQVKSSTSEIEPIMRYGDIFSFNINALKSTEAPSSSDPFPSGFNIEELCQLSRYAGINDRVSSLGIHGLNNEVEVDKITARSIALIIWYYLEGMSQRKNDTPNSGEQLTEYLVSSEKTELELHFYKSNKTGRWWFRKPKSDKSSFDRENLIPCSYEDYVNATKEEFSDRIVNLMK